MLSRMSATTGAARGNRTTGRVLTVLGGVAGAGAGMAALSAVVTSGLDDSGRTSPAPGYVVALALLVVAVVLAALGARMLGVRSVVARAGYAALVAASGFVALWVVAIAVGRLAS